MRRGADILNRAINALPLELHIPGYQYCGPGTRLQHRLARGDRGVNPLDRACMTHDIAYAQHKNLEERHEADKTLAAEARTRVTARDASFGERAAAAAVWAAMNAKTKLGMGMILKRKSKKESDRRKLKKNDKRKLKKNDKRKQRR